MSKFVLCEINNAIGSLFFTFESFLDGRSLYALLLLVQMLIFIIIRVKSITYLTIVYFTSMYGRWFNYLIQVFLFEVFNRNWTNA
ncbi:MAG: hypothetical protein CL912_14590 [Deltaproteobacteria bacterium]|nr:hypothetical protein [Deltaproteobacteria bacterium]